tara:strand:- start:1214 stop:2176 length:963 start_codon:yes stop_codon:yes gene_type:complete
MFNQTSLESKTMPYRKSYKTKASKVSKAERVAAMKLAVANKVRHQMLTAGKDWLKDWVTVPGQGPMSLSTGKNYRGINWLILSMERVANGYSSDKWATLPQWNKRGYKVSKGEKSTTVVLYKPVVYQDKETGEDKAYSYFDMFYVFNADQVIDENGEKPAFDEAVPEFSQDETLADDFAQRCGASITYGNPNSAFYAPAVDTINMPKSGQFNSPEAYQATLLHELTHWTKHPSRLDRNLGRDRKGYAREELVAELGAAMLCGVLNISLEPREDHAKYLNNWIELLKDEPDAIFKAAAKASEATDYLLELNEAAWDEVTAA